MNKVGALIQTLTTTSLEAVNNLGVSADETLNFIDGRLNSGDQPNDYFHTAEAAVGTLVGTSVALTLLELMSAHPQAMKLVRLAIEYDMWKYAAEATAKVLELLKDEES